MILILGGSSEASDLARALAARPDRRAMLSLAGRTARPAPSPIPLRVGGFGGAEGLARFLDENKVEALIDATHPFAAQISNNAALAAQETGTPFLVVRRPAWRAEPGDRWIEVETAQAAAAALGNAPRRVFLTLGRLELPAFLDHPEHFYLIRTIDPPDRVPPDAQVILARGPFLATDELELLQAHAIDVLVTKNSGGSAAFAKIAAARRLSLPVILLRPPVLPEAPAVATAREALAWLDAILGDAL